MRKIALFDMDGTLTPPEKKSIPKLSEHLDNLKKSMKLELLQDLTLNMSISKLDPHLTSVD